MPLQHLIHSFNERFITENTLKSAPLSYVSGEVKGHLGDLRFTSRFNSVRLFANPQVVTGHDAVSCIISEASENVRTLWLYSSDDNHIVCLDRLSRTVHMLNYLPISHEGGDLFLQVNPHHVLSIKKDHGAYFEEIIHRCGLPLRRIVISLNVSKPLERKLPTLLERLSNYRNRGYSTAIRFDDDVGSEFLEHYCLQYLHRYSPDFVRFNLRYFQTTFSEKGSHRRRDALLKAIRRQDIQLAISGVDCEYDFKDALVINPDFAQGLWYESSNAFRVNTLAV